MLLYLVLWKQKKVEACEIITLYSFLTRNVLFFIWNIAPLFPEYYSTSFDILSFLFSQVKVSRRRYFWPWAEMQTSVYFWREIIELDQTISTIHRQKENNTADQNNIKRLIEWHWTDFLPWRDIDHTIWTPATRGIYRPHTFTGQWRTPTPRVGELCCTTWRTKSTSSVRWGPGGRTCSPWCVCSPSTASSLWLG